MPAPTFTRPIQGSPPNQFVENAQDVAALNAALEQLYLAVAAGAPENIVQEIVAAIDRLQQDADRAEAALSGITLVAGSTGYQPDVATAEAALTDGDVFWTVEGEETVQYQIVSGSAVEIPGARYPSAAVVRPLVFVDPALAFSPAGVHGTSAGTQNLVYGADGYFSRSTGTGSYLNFIELDDEAKSWSALEVRVPARGTFSAPPFAQLLDGSGAIGSQVNGDFDAETSEYVIVLPMTGEPTRVRVRWSTTSDGEAKGPYLIESKPERTLIDPATPSGARVVEAWHRELFRRSGNIFTCLPNTSQVSVAPGATLASDRKTVSAQAGGFTSWSFPVAGLVGADDYVLVLARLLSPATSIRNIGGTARSGNDANVTSVNGQIYQEREYFVRAFKAQDGLGDPAHRVGVAVDARSDFVPETDAVVEFLAVFAVPSSHVWAGRILADPALLMERLAAWEQTEGFVSADAAAEGAERTYATLPEAIRAGHRRITCGDPQRLPEGLTVPGRGREIVLEAGAFVRGSSAHPISDFAATSADPNVYFRAMSYDPDIIVEVEGSLFKRMEIFNPSGTGLSNRATSEQEVRDNAGSYWHGDGSEGVGVYLRPFADAIAAKTWEIPFERARDLIRDQFGGQVEIRQDARTVSGVCRRNLVVEHSSVTLAGGIWRSCDNNGWSPVFNENTQGFLKSALLTDAGNDGWNSNPESGYLSEFTMENASVDFNVSDGISAHGTGRSKIYGIGRCSISQNGKFDVVHIAPCDMRMEYLVARGSRDGGLLHQHSFAEPDTFEFGFLDTDTVNFNTSNDVSVGRIVGLIDTVVQAENVAIVRLAAE